jgi:hypothetical protein
MYATTAATAATNAAAATAKREFTAEEARSSIDRADTNGGECEASPVRTGHIFQIKATNEKIYTRLMSWTPKALNKWSTVILKVLGAGHSSFSPGSDGGRDGYLFEGKAPLSQHIR